MKNFDTDKLFKPVLSEKDAKTEAQYRAAREIIGQQAESIAAKTARLRAARLAKEQADQDDSNARGTTPKGRPLKR